MSKHGEIGKAALKAGFDRATGRRYLALGQTPSELATEARDWRTREDPFEEDWSEVEEMLNDAPTLSMRA